jgi:hypothetical protein
VVEGTPLLRVQARKGLEGSNPFVSAISLLPWNSYRADFARYFCEYSGNWLCAVRDLLHILLHKALHANLRGRCRLACLTA